MGYWTRVHKIEIILEKVHVSTCGAWHNRKQRALETLELQTLNSAIAKGERAPAQGGKAQQEAWSDGEPGCKEAQGREREAHTHAVEPYSHLQRNLRGAEAGSEVPKCLVEAWIGIVCHVRSIQTRVRSAGGDGQAVV